MSEDGPDPVAVLEKTLDVLRDHLDRVQRANDELRAELSSRADDPLIRDVLLVLDACARTARGWEGRDAAGPADVVAALRGVADDLQQVLARAGVEAITPETGTPFDRGYAQVVGVADDGDGAANRVLSVVRPGYRSGNRVLRHAQVVVSRPTGR